MSQTPEVLFDEKEGYLQLVCKPADFARFQELLKQHFADRLELDVEQVMELNILDQVRCEGRRQKPRRKMWTRLFAAALYIGFILALVGLVSIITALIGFFSN